MDRVRVWQLATVGLAATLAVLVVISILDWSSLPVSQTKEKWFSYKVAVPDAVNSTNIPARTFCPDPGAPSAGLVALTWNTTPTQNVSQIQLFYLLPPDSNHPGGVIVNLYYSTNASSGAAAFPSGSLTDPVPCGYTWILGASALTPVTVTAVLVLVFNETAS
jgi:hypothetical protein